jgi:hypothetical protein
MAAHDGNGLHQRGLGELFRELGDEVTTLAKQEVERALTACLIMALDGAIPNWAAALLVGGVLVGVAAGLALAGRERIRTGSPPVPEETIESTKEDIRWAKTQLQSGRR